MKRYRFFLMTISALMVIVALLLGDWFYDPSIYLFRVHKGMSPDLVAAIVGKPMGISGSGSRDAYGETWYYTHGSVSFMHGKAVNISTTL